MKTSRILAAITLALALPVIEAAASDKTPRVQVSPTTYIRAETDRSFQNIQSLAGGINRFYHFREPTPLDKQTVVRMNRDTLYSSAVIDTSKGATITLPQADKDRYMSVLVIDNDHYAPTVIYDPGTHNLPTETRYIMTIVRTQLLRPLDPADVAAANRLQDEVKIVAGSAEPMPEMQWDKDSLTALTKEYEAGSKQFSSWKGMMGPRGTVDEKIRHYAAAAAWGLFPEQHATYLNYNGGESADRCYTATYKVPENKAFWSITLYGGDGYMKSDNAILNKTNAKLNADGTFTGYFGSKAQCGDVPNRLDTVEGWNFLMRIYRPGPTVLDGSYTLPKTEAVAR
jgi:hypothetical protein